MRTALQIINRAAAKIGVKRAGVDLTDDEINDAIDELNDMMLEIDAAGTALNYTIVSSKTDLITTPDWTYGAMSSQLGIRIAPEYEVSVSGELATQANESWKIVLKRTEELNSVNFPTTMPIGAGNEYWDNERFYTNEYADDLQTASGGTLADLEDINIQED